MEAGGEYSLRDISSVSAARQHGRARMSVFGWFGGSSKKADVVADVSLPSVFPTTNRASQAMPWTQEELSAFYRTRNLLLSPNYGLTREQLTTRELFLCVVNCKNRPDKAAKKYSTWLKALSEFGMSNFSEIYSFLCIEPDGCGDPAGWQRLKPMLTSFAGCGLDLEQRSIMWIRTRPTQIDEEIYSVRASVLYFTAIHADLTSMREGITFVLDTAANPEQGGAFGSSKIGNEQKLQRFYQSMPLRPQTIYILGTNFFTRTIINAIISLASLFTSEKVIDRVRFAEMEEVKTKIAHESLPVHVGGGSKLDSNDKVFDWMIDRLRSFSPLPDLWFDDPHPQQ